MMIIIPLGLYGLIMMAYSIGIILEKWPRYLANGSSYAFWTMIWNGLIILCWSVLLICVLIRDIKFNREMKKKGW